MFGNKKTAGRSRRARPRTPSPPPVEEVQEQDVDPRQLSPGMGDYGMDDQHMDGTEGFEDAHVSTPPRASGPVQRCMQRVEAPTADVHGVGNIWSTT